MSRQSPRGKALSNDLRRAWLMIALLLVATTPSARAESDPDKWKFSITPYLVGASLTGDVTLGPRTSDLDITLSDLLEDLKFIFMGDGEATKGKWTLFVNGILYEGDTSDTSFTDANFVDTVVQGKATVDYSILEGGAMYRLGTWPLGKRADESSGGYRKTWSLEALAGARWTDVEVETQIGAGFQTVPINRRFLSIPSLSDAAIRQGDRGASWTDPFVGVRMFFHTAEKWTLFVRGDVGGFGVGSEFSWNAVGGVNYQFRRNMGVMVGYKGLYQDYKEGSGITQFEWDMTLHGPALGLNITF